MKEVPNEGSAIKIINTRMELSALCIVLNITSLDLSNPDKESLPLSHFAGEDTDVQWGAQGQKCWRLDPGLILHSCGSALQLPNKTKQNF